MLDLNKLRKNFDNQIDQVNSEDFLIWLMKRRYNIDLKKGEVDFLSEIPDTIVTNNTISFSNQTLASIKLESIKNSNFKIAA